MMFRIFYVRHHSSNYFRKNMELRKNLQSVYNIPIDLLIRYRVLKITDQEVNDRRTVLNR